MLKLSKNLKTKNKYENSVLKWESALQGIFPFFIVTKGAKTMNQYSYNGPVMEFNNCVANCWKGSTFAVSERKARSNLAYQFKQKNNKMPNSKIILPGKIIMVL